MSDPALSPSAAARLVEYALEASQLVALELSQNGRVVGCNRAAERLFGPALLEGGFRSIFVDFEQTSSLQAWADEGRPCPRNISTASGLPETLLFAFRRAGETILAVGEHNADETREMHRSWLSLTQDLNNTTRELHKKNVELQRLHALKNEFLGMAAHDLRNPIANIVQLCDLLLINRGALKAEHVELISMMNDLSSFMLQLLEDLLDVSAIEAGTFKLRLSEEDAARLIDQALLLGGRNAQAQGIKIEWERPSEPLRLRVDSQKFVQAATNLISNAVKYSPRNSRIKMETALAGGVFRFGVLDQGPGISRKDQERLFKPFQTGPTQSQSGEKSTGLGLLIVKKIVAAHGGKAGVVSELGSGSCFWFELPDGWAGIPR